ncbi:hypothetical protein D3C78_1478620 [compost metagenome]
MYEDEPGTLLLPEREAWVLVALEESREVLSSWWVRERPTGDPDLSLRPRRRGVRFG